MTNREWLNTLSDEDFVSWLLDDERVKDYQTYEVMQPTPKLETLKRTATSSSWMVSKWLKEER